jgi:hypothetical protein
MLMDAPPHPRHNYNIHSHLREWPTKSGVSAARPPATLKSKSVFRDFVDDAAGSCFQTILLAWKNACWFMVGSEPDFRKGLFEFYDWSPP